MFGGSWSIGIELQRRFIKKTCDVNLHTGLLHINGHTKIIKKKKANVMCLFILLINKDDTIYMHGRQTMLKAFFLFKKNHSHPGLMKYYILMTGSDLNCSGFGGTE